MKKFDVKLKDKIFTNKVWRSFLITEKMENQSISKSKVELNKLYISYMGVNPFSMLKASLMRDGDKNYVSMFNVVQNKHEENYHQLKTKEAHDLEKVGSSETSNKNDISYKDNLDQDSEPEVK